MERDGDVARRELLPTSGVGSDLLITAEKTRVIVPAPKDRVVGRLRVRPGPVSAPAGLAGIAQ